MNISNKVYSYPTESKLGFTDDEIFKLLSEFTNIDRQVFYSLLNGNTVCMNEKNQIIWYAYDVEKALIYALNNPKFKDIT